LELINGKSIKWIRVLLLIAIGIFSLCANIKKNNKDLADSTASASKIDSISKQNEGLKNDNTRLTLKLDSINVYLRRLDSMGVKNVNNFPNFKQFKDNATNVESHHQHGGQTGRDFNNTYGSKTRITTDANE
jgi:hypothetical protein